MSKYFLQVVSVRGGGTLGVVVQGLHTKETFCMEHHGNITSLKFAPDHSRLAVQRTPNSLELLSFSGGGVGAGVVVECRTKSATLLGFVWADQDDLVLVTSHGVEFYHVSRERVFVRLVRSYSLSGCRWFVWSAECHLLLVAAGGGTGPPGQLPLYPFQFAAQYSNKMPKCIVDLNYGAVVGSGRGKLSSSGTSEQPALGERDVCVAFVYKPAILVLQHPVETHRSAQLLVYTNLKDSTGFKLSHVCQLELSGSFAVNVIDSLIIVHHQVSKISMVFDVALGTEMRNGVCFVYPATQPAPIRPCFLEEPSVTATVTAATTGSGGLSSGPANTAASVMRDVVGVDNVTAGLGALTVAHDPAAVNRIPCQLYALTWVVFQPSVIIDARLGCLWSLQLDLPAFAATFTDSVQLVNCLLNRRHAKPLVLRAVRAVAERRSLHTLAFVFDCINAGYRRHLDAITAQTQAGSAGGVSGGGAYGTLTTPTSSLLQQPSAGASSVNVFAGNAPAVVVEAVDIYSSVLSPMMEEAQTMAKNSDEREVGVQEHAVDSNISNEKEKNEATSESPEEVVAKATEATNEAMTYLVSVTLEYTRSLGAAGLPVPDFLHQLVVNAFLHTRSFFQLHQLLQYHVIPDSKPLACVLLSRAGMYPACQQLSLDMLSRLHATHEEIMEVLLANGELTLALRYARANGLEDTLSCRKYLEAALQTGDDSLFHATFSLFALRNTRLRGARPFGEDESGERREGAKGVALETTPYPRPPGPGGQPAAGFLAWLAYINGAALPIQPFCHGPC